MTKGNKNRSQAGGKSRDDVERKRDERARRNALKKEREAKEYLENDENFVSFANQLQAVGYKIKDIKGDGNCLFRALADQLDGDDSGHLRYRRITAKYLADHREEFEPFVEDNKSFDEHVKELSKPGTFGGNDSVVAFSRCHGVNIVIHQLNERCWVIQGQHYSTSTSAGELKELHVSYHNQNHYSSVRRIDDPDDGPAWLFNNQHKVKEKPVPCETKSKYSNNKSKLNDTEVYCEGAGLPDQSSDIAIIQAATGCEDSQLIWETLSETNNDLDGTISYILQLQSFMNIEEPKEDKGSLANLSVHNNIESTDKIDAEQHQDESCNVGHVEIIQEAEPSSTITDNSAMTRKSQLPSKPNHGARPKVRQQNSHVSNRKRKQLAKQEKKTRRMEERREEALKKQEPQNLENHQTNQTLPIMGDLEALEI